MTTVQRPFIFYSLPKSRTTQRLTGGKIEKVWAGVTSFLTNCTTVSIDEPSSVCLIAYSAWKDDEHPEVADKIIADTKVVFGQPKTEPVTFHYPSGVPDTQTKNEWRLDKTDLQKTVDYLISGQPWAKFTFGPVELIVSYDFKLVNPTTKVELPNQEQNSRLMVWLSRSCCCSPDLCFPFDTATKDFNDYLNKIETYLPFKLEHKYLRLARPHKNGTAYIYSKLSQL